MTTLNRMVRLAEGGAKAEPDQKHVDTLVKSVGLESEKVALMSRAKGDKAVELGEHRDKLKAEQAAHVRSGTMHATYLAQER